MPGLLFGCSTLQRHAVVCGAECRAVACIARVPDCNAEVQAVELLEAMHLTGEEGFRVGVREAGCVHLVPR